MPVVAVLDAQPAVWALIQDEVRQPTAEGWRADVEFMIDTSLDGMSEADLGRAHPKLYPSGYRHAAVLIADRHTFASAEHPLLVINLNRRVSDPPFRAVPAMVQGIENNLTGANMDFRELARAVDGDGVFRGF